MLLKNLSCAALLLSTPALAQDTETAPPTEFSSSDSLDANPAPATHVQTDEAIKGTDAEGVLGFGRIGPSIRFSFPNGMSYGVDGTVYKIFGYGASFGGMSMDSDGFPLNITGVDGVSVKISHWDVRARYMPFKGSFFLGMAFGNQSVTGSMEKDIEVSGRNIKTSTELEVSSAYYTPHLGWHWVWDSGFMLGTEFGWQFNSVKSTNFETSMKGASEAEVAELKNTKEYKDMKKSSEDIGEKIGETSVPSLALIKIGWWF